MLCECVDGFTEADLLHPLPSSSLLWRHEWVIHTYIHTLMAVDVMHGADQHIRSSLGVQYLAQGLFNTQARGIKPATFWQQDAGSAPEPQPPQILSYLSRSYSHNIHVQIWHVINELKSFQSTCLTLRLAGWQQSKKVMKENSWCFSSAVTG